MFDRYMDSGEAGTAAKKSVTLMVSVIIHVALIVSAIILPLLFPDTVSGSIQRLSFLVTPPLPPAPPPPPAPEAVARRIPSTVVRDAFQAPVEIPKEILIGMDEAPPFDSLIAGIPGGVSGGIPGGVPGGIIDGVFGGDPAPLDPLPLPPGSSAGHAPSKGARGWKRAARHPLPAGASPLPGAGVAGPHPGDGDSGSDHQHGRFGKKPAGNQGPSPVDRARPGSCQAVALQAHRAQWRPGGSDHSNYREVQPVSRSASLEETGF